MEQMNLDMRKLVELWKVSSLSRKDFCAEHGLTDRKLRYWQEKLSKVKQASNNVNFLPLEVKEKENTMEKTRVHYPKFELILFGLFTLRLY